MRTGLFTLSVAIVTLVIGACATATIAAAPVSANSGADVYQANCAACHGAQLEGNSGPPLISPGIGATDLASLTAQIKQTMPRDAPGSLSDADYQAVAGYVLSRNGAAH